MDRQFFSNLQGHITGKCYGTVLVCLAFFFKDSSGGGTSVFCEIKFSEDCVFKGS